MAGKSGEMEVDLDLEIDLEVELESGTLADGEPGLWERLGEHPLALLTAVLGAAWLAVEGARRAVRRRQPWRDAGRSRLAGAPGGSRFDAGVRRAGHGIGGIGALFEQRPMAAGAAAAALGVLAGLALPATRREDEAMGDRRDEMLESAREAGREALEQGRQVARGAGRRVRESLHEQQLTPEQLAEKVRHVAQDAVDSVHQAERDFLRGFSQGAEGAEGDGREPGPARDF